MFRDVQVKLSKISQFYPDKIKRAPHGNVPVYAFVTVAVD